MRWIFTRALYAAWRAWAATITLSTIVRACLGCSSRNVRSASLTAVCTAPMTSLFPSLVLVCPSNCGSITLTEMTAVRPSRKSSLLMSTFTFSSILLSSAYFLSVDVSPRRNPVRCVPPSMVLMLLTNEYTFSLYVLLYVSATSTGMPWRSVLRCMTSSIRGSLLASMYFTNSLRPFLE